MKKKGLVFFLYAAMMLLNFLESCSKSNETGTEAVYNSWTFTHGRGTISVNGNALGVSESFNSGGNFIIQFEKPGTYHYQIKSLVDETGGFSLTDSTIQFASDSSFFARLCAYPEIIFLSSPDQIPPIQRHVSQNLQIVYVSRDSLLLMSKMTKAGMNAADTVYTEYSGFRKQ